MGPEMIQENQPNDEINTSQSDAEINNASPPTKADVVRQYLTEVSKRATAACAGFENPGYLQISSMPPDGAMSSQRFRLDDIDTMIAVAIAQSETGLNAYIELRTIRPDAPKIGRGKKEHTQFVFAVTVDDDGDKGKPAFLDLDPSILVESSPGNTHRTYCFTQAVTAEYGEEIGRLVKALAGGDDNTGVITQPYRIAGTINFPDAKKRARGRIPSATRILSIGPSYDPEALKSALLDEFTKRGQEPPRKSSSGQDADFAPIDKSADELLRKIWWRAELEMELARTWAEDRSADFHSLMWRLYHDGYSPAEIAVLIRAFPNSCWMEKYGDRLEQEIARSWGKIDGNSRVDHDDSSDNKASQDSANDERWDSAADADEPSPDGSKGQGGHCWTLGIDSLPKTEPGLVAGLIPSNGLVFVGGQSGAGKSFTLCTMAVCVAAYRPFFGYQITEPGGVIYIAAEGASTIPARLHAARVGLGLPDQPYAVHLVSKGIGDLSAPRDRRQIIDRIKQINNLSQERHGLPVKAVFLDTLTAGFSLRDESSSADASRVCKAASELGDSIGAVTIVAHHYGKTSDSGLRGSSAFRAGAESVVSIQADRNELSGKCSNRCLVLTKSRTGPEGATHAFGLKEVDIGCDGLEPIISAHIVPLDEPVKSAQGRSMSVTLRRLKSALEQALLEYGYERQIFADGPILRVVDREHVRKIFYANTPADGDPMKAANARRQAFNRAYDAAEKIGMAKCYDAGDSQLMWLL